MPGPKRRQSPYLHAAHRLPDMRARRRKDCTLCYRARSTGRRAFSWNFSITVMRYVVGGYPAGGERPRPALNGKAHASAACCSLFRAVRDARDLARQLRRMPVQVMLGVQTETKTETLKLRQISTSRQSWRRSCWVYLQVSVAEDRRFELLRGCPNALSKCAPHRSRQAGSVRDLG